MVELKSILKLLWNNRDILKLLWNNRDKIKRHRKVKKGVKAIVEAYRQGDFDNLSYGQLEKYGIADMSKTALGEPSFIFDGTMTPPIKGKD